MKVIYALVLFFSVFSCQHKAKKKHQSSPPPETPKPQTQVEPDADAIEKEIDGTIHDIQTKMEDYTEDPQPPTTTEIEQINDIIATGASQDPNDIKQFVMSDQFDNVNHAKDEVKDDLVVIAEQNGMEVSEQDRKTRSLESAGVFMVSLGVLGIFFTLPMSVLTGIAAVDPGVHTSKVASFFAERVLNEELFEKKIEVLESKHGWGKIKTGMSYLKAGEIGLIMGLVATLGMSLTLIAVGAEVIKDDQSSSSLKHKMAGVLITAGALSSLVGLKLAKNAWTAGRGLKSSMRNVGIFAMLPLAIGVSAFAVGATGFLLTEDQKLLRLLREIDEDLQKLEHLRARYITAISANQPSAMGE